MKRLLLLSTALLALSVAPASAAVIANLGINPTSATGHFSNAPPVGAFDDQYTFQLVGGPLDFFTVASATNVFPNVRDEIIGFNGSLYRQVGTVDPAGPGGDDVLLFGPQFATNNCGTNCQGFGGSAILPSGFYYLDIEGINLGTAGYGGDLATSPIAGAVPEASTWAMMLLGFAGIGFMAYRKQNNGGLSFRVA
jgi:hypothetical protein